jgi:hypothetical protein
MGGSPTAVVAATTTSAYPLTALHTFLLAAIVIAVSVYMKLSPTLLDSTRSLALLTVYLL